MAENENPDIEMQNEPNAEEEAANAAEAMAELGLDGQPLGNGEQEGPAAGAAAPQAAALTMQQLWAFLLQNPQLMAWAQQQVPGAAVTAQQR